MTKDGREVAFFFATATPVWLSATLFSMCLTGFDPADASHFRGGLILWRTVDGNNETAQGGVDRVALEVTQRFAWRRDWGVDTFCNQTTIDERSLAGEDGDLRCQVGCHDNAGILGSVRVYCTDFSERDGWMIGERSYPISVQVNGSRLEASFTGGAWITLVTGGGSWELRVKMTLNSTALAKRGSNASPVTKMSPVLKLVSGSFYTIRIPYVDPDGDPVRCRWARSELGECADVCMAFTGAVLDENRCTIRYNATGQIGVYAVAVQIEDFYHANDSVPISSTPLQFIVNLTHGSASPGSARPPWFVVPPTSADGSCVHVPPNATYRATIVAAADANRTIADISTQSPLGMTKSALSPAPGSDQWHVDVSWTPSIPSQLGSTIFCFVAVDDDGATSDQSCVTLAVGAALPVIRALATSPRGGIRPDNDVWTVEFDGPISRPSRSAFVRFREESGEEVLAIDTSTSPDVRFPDSGMNPSTLSFVTNFTFADNSSYYVTFDEGIVVGSPDCRAQSAGVRDSDFWKVTTGSESSGPCLPLLVFRQTPGCSEPLTRAEVSCSFPEHSVCLVDTQDMLLSLPCDGSSVSLTGLRQGFYTLTDQVQGQPDDLRLIGHFGGTETFGCTTTAVTTAVRRDPGATERWTEWSMWSRCPTEPGRTVGVQQRVRRCPDGSCSGDSTNVRFCYSTSHLCTGGTVDDGQPGNDLACDSKTFTLRLLKVVTPGHSSPGQTSTPWHSLSVVPGAAEGTTETVPIANASSAGSATHSPQRSTDSSTKTNCDSAVVAGAVTGIVIFVILAILTAVAIFFIGRSHRKWQIFPTAPAPSDEETAAPGTDSEQADVDQKCNGVPPKLGRI